MVSITVLYTDLTFQKVPIDKIDTLPKDGVLFIKLSTDKREGKLANLSQSFGFDHYAVLYKKDKGDWYALTGWNEKDFIWRQDCNDCINRVPADIPFGTMHTIFRGILVSPEEWKKAEVIINKEI